MRTLCRFALLCFLLPAVAHAQEPERRPIEHYISPPQLFPMEGQPRAPYLPFAAYDGPDGKIIGRVIANLQPCGPQTPLEECYKPFTWRLSLPDGTEIELPHDMVDYEQEAFVSYQPARIAAGKAWSKVEYEDGAFWIRTEADDIINYEERAAWVQDFDTWCDMPGKCAPVSPAMCKEIDKVVAGGYASLFPAPAPYEIEGVVTRNGKRYYQVKRTEVEPGTPEPRLPKTGYIPTRRKDGQHVGQFSPKGC